MMLDSFALLDDWSWKAFASNLPVKHNGGSSKGIASIVHSCRVEVWWSSVMQLCQPMHVPAAAGQEADGTRVAPSCIGRVASNAGGDLLSDLSTLITIRWFGVFLWSPVFEREISAVKITSLSHFLKIPLFPHHKMWGLTHWNIRILSLLAVDS